MLKLRTPCSLFDVPQNDPLLMVLLVAFSLFVFINEG